MMKPTQDKSLQTALEMLINDGVFRQIGTPAIAKNITAELEKQGYHIGLPESIEWALNSGDGSYHP